MACVYKIFCNDISITDCYIGSTIDFRRRRNGHISKSNNINCPKYNLKVYRFIRENGGWNNWTMVKIEDCEVDNKLQLEQKYYNQLQPSLNSQRPFVTEEQRKISNSISTKAWYKKNEKECRIKRKEYDLKNKDKISKNLKEYRLKNKDKLLKQRKKRYEAINKKRREQYAKKKLLKK